MTLEISPKQSHHSKKKNWNKFTSMVANRLVCLLCFLLLRLVKRSHRCGKIGLNEQFIRKQLHCSIHISISMAVELKTKTKFTKPSFFFLCANNLLYRCKSLFFFRLAVCLTGTMQNKNLFDLIG